MKKLFTLLLATVMMLSVCGCGGGSDDSGTSTPPADTSEPSAGGAVYKLGDTIETELFKITPVFTGYAYALSNVMDESYLTPVGKRDDENPYSAGEGKTQMYGEVQIEYIGNEKTDVSLDISISVNYDDGYIFEGGDVDSAFCTTVDGDWQSYGAMVFEPLSSSTTRIVRYCIEVPEQVESNADKSLLTTFLVNGEPFVYDFRSAEVRGSDYDPRGEFYQPISEDAESQIISYLKANGLEAVGWYDQTIGTFTFTFGDTSVNAILPLSPGSDYGYEFNGTYEVFSGAILINWDYGQQMHLDYTFDGTTLNVVDFSHDR